MTRTSDHACSSYEYSVSSISHFHLLIKHFTGLEFVTYLGKELSAAIIWRMPIIALA